MPFLPTVSTLFIIISAVLMAIGWNLISKGKAKAHKITMITSAISALLFLIIYMSRTIFMGNTSFGGPEELKIYYTIFLIFHIFLATTGAVFVVVTLMLAFKRKINIHRKVGPITAIIWFFTAITGVMVYLFLYVFWGVGDTTNLFRAIWGF